AAAGNETVKFTAEEPVKGRRKAPGGAKTGRPEKYRKAFVYRFLNPLLKQYQYIRLKQNRESLAVTGEIS
ncbi:MAG: hypothetical protein LBH43_10555, partial [Treponema sp.]|nr:hypothetical protein [Treponema sp.]